MRSIIPQRILFILPFAALIVCSAAARAEVQKFLHPCGGLQLCASYQMVLTPPEGWAVDEKASNENKIQIMVPNGQSFASAEPLIYVQVFYHAEQQTLGDFARASNARWIAPMPLTRRSSKPIERCSLMERKRNPGVAHYR
jgi:hypothetical protein